ncbi:NAD(P)-binding protein [Pholiota conissans]|uniref:NAD(P)-binding protein n=1 Tax=Pholiota conissans TaxID=109636 RepID=A0A9P6D1R6_9AGAR|nr:NAD(P)-binding protein [Pholiota conissans]
MPSTHRRKTYHSSTQRSQVFSVYIMSKVVLITGANSGVGFELARFIAEKGHIVYIGARNEDSGQKAVDMLHSEGFKTVKLVVIDITQPSIIKSARETIEENEGRLDVLVNNAGIALMDEDQSAVTPSMPAVREIIETNFYGTIETTVVFIPLLRKSTCTPVILNVSSSFGSNKQSQVDARAKFVGYRASKAAINSYTIALAMELKDEGFKVNSVTPGITATKMTHDIGQPVSAGGLAILPWALLDIEGPTGKFFGSDGKELPW